MNTKEYSMKEIRNFWLRGLKKRKEHLLKMEKDKNLLFKWQLKILFLVEQPLRVKQPEILCSFNPKNLIYEEVINKEFKFISCYSLIK